MATHSSIPAWRIPWTEEPGRPQSMGLPRVRHDLVTRLPPYYICRFPGGSVVKNLPTNAGDVVSILGLGRSPEEGNGNPL